MAVPDIEAGKVKFCDQAGDGSRKHLYGIFPAALPRICRCGSPQQSVRRWRGIGEQRRNWSLWNKRNIFTVDQLKRNQMQMHRVGVRREVGNLPDFSVI